MNLKIKTKQCAGCRLCALVCATKKSGNMWEGDSAIRIENDLPKSFKTTLRFCIQCKQGYCIETCPRDALVRNDRGYVELNESLCDRCDGAFECVKACRYGGMHINSERTFPVKCDLCGGDPECVKICPERIISLAPTSGGKSESEGAA